jgi:hypothetical protein
MRRRLLGISARMLRLSLRPWGQATRVVNRAASIMRLIRPTALGTRVAGT